jgi:hypothetical protein
VVNLLDGSGITVCGYERGDSKHFININKCPHISNVFCVAEGVVMVVILVQNS